MKFAVLALALGLSTTAYAEWTRIGAAETHILYVDSASIQRARGFTQLSLLRDYLQPQLAAEGVTYRSARSDWEFDCGRGVQRMRRSLQFAGHLGRGTVVSASRKVGPWLLPPDATAGAGVMDYACPTKKLAMWISTTALPAT